MSHILQESIGDYHVPIFPRSPQLGIVLKVLLDHWSEDVTWNEQGLITENQTTSQEVNHPNLPGHRELTRMGFPSTI